MNHEQLYNLTTLLFMWATYTLSAFKGENTVELFRSLQYSDDGESLFDKVLMSVYDLNNEMVGVFDMMVKTLDYDYLPLWVVRHKNGVKFHHKMTDIVIRGQSYTVPPREILEELHKGFLTLHTYIKDNGVELDLTFFMFCLEELLEELSVHDLHSL